MGAHKHERASMREGPLAALFRKTDDTVAPAAAPAPAAQPVERDEPAAAAPPPPEAEERERPRIPTPQERLRAAFATELPENMLEIGASRGTGEPAPADPYARPVYPEHTAPASPAQPRLRVVGVGGAGVN